MGERFVTGDPLVAGPVPPLPDVELDPKTSALICIDLQRYDASPEGSLFSRHRDAFADYFKEVETVVLPSVAAVQAAFRRAGMQVIHTRIRSLSSDGRDVGRRHRQRGMFVPPESADGEFLEEVAPVAGEIVIDKTRSGAFFGTGLEASLRGLGISTLLFCGVVLSNCVESTVREAADRDYDCVVISDGVASLNEEMYHASMRVLGDSYARVLTSDQVVDQVSHKQ